MEGGTSERHLTSEPGACMFTMRQAVEAKAGPSQTSQPEGATHQGAPPEVDAHQEAPPLGAAHQGAPPEGDAHQEAPPLGAAHQGAPPEGDAHQETPPQGAAHQGAPPEGDAHQEAPPQGLYGEGLREMLSSVVGEVRRAISRDVNGAELLHGLLSSPWLHPLLRVYECLLQFQTLPPCPLLPCASRLSLEVMACLRAVSSPSAEAQELYCLLTAPHMQALLSAHDSVVQSDFEPILPPLPENLPETEEAMRIICLVKNQQPLNGGGIHSRWNSLRRLTLERLVPGRRAWSGEELEDRGEGDRYASTGLLPPLSPGKTRPLPRYQSTGSCRLCRQTSQLWEKGLNQSAPSVYNTARFGGAATEMKQNGPDNNDSADYAYPPFPLPAFSLTTPNSPTCYPSTGGRTRTMSTPGTAASSPMAQRRTRHGSLNGPRRPSLKVANQHPSLDLTNHQHPSLDLINYIHPSMELVKQASLDELRSTVHMAASSMENSTSHVRDLGQRMVAATELMSDSVEENAQALNLLAEVVDKLQGLIIASKTPETPRLKPSTPHPGATIKKDEETGEIFIARVIHGGLADRSGLLHPGDQLVEVNGNPVEGLDPEQVIQILIHSQGTILFKVIPNTQQSANSQTLLYVRAMVDYCPLQDPAIPCPDAGMAFSKGDLLEIVDQTDAHWWQARKLPSTTSCAGLIPSTSLLKSKQREQWWSQPCQADTCNKPCEEGLKIDDVKCIKADEEDFDSEEAESDSTVDGIYIAGFRRSFRLWKRMAFRKREQPCFSCSPSSTLANPYEEVVTYQRPLQDPHRLIVLVGVSGVGVNTLRKQLIQLNPEAFQGPVPHTTRSPRDMEQTGREYNFVTKELFEYMICNHRFLEYGEHKGQLYGTSYEAVTDVLDTGSICVMDVEPHNIQALRTRKLKPFVIFVRPPSMERLKLTRREAHIITNYNVTRPFTDEYFKELEESSRLIEVKYSQFFDSVIVNDELQDSCKQLFTTTLQAQEGPQWIPATWLGTEEP